MTITITIANKSRDKKVLSLAKGGKKMVMAVLAEPEGYTAGGIPLDPADFGMKSIDFGICNSLIGNAVIIGRDPDDEGTLFPYLRITDGAGVELIEGAPFGWVNLILFETGKSTLKTVPS